MSRYVASVCRKSDYKKKKQCCDDNLIQYSAKREYRTGQTCSTWRRIGGSREYFDNHACLINIGTDIYITLVYDSKLIV